MSGSFAKLRWPVAAVAAAWVALNGAMVRALLPHEFKVPPPGGPARGLALTALAWVLAPAAGALAAWGVWRFLGDSPTAFQRGLRWTLAAAAAGFASWATAALLAALARSFDGRAPVAAVLLGMLGAGLHMIAGAALAAAAEWRRHED